MVPGWIPIWNMPGVSLTEMSHPKPGITNRWNKIMYDRHVVWINDFCTNGSVCVIWYFRVLQWPGCSSFFLCSVFPEPSNAKTWHCSKEHFHHFARSITTIIMCPRTIKGKDKSMTLGETSKTCIFYWKHSYRLVKPLNTTRNVSRNWGASLAGEWQVWLLLLFPSLLRGV